MTSDGPSSVVVAAPEAAAPRTRTMKTATEEANLVHQILTLIHPLIQCQIVRLHEAVDGNASDSI